MNALRTTTLGVLVVVFGCALTIASGTNLPAGVETAPGPEPELFIAAGVGMFIYALLVAGANRVAEGEA